jgi:HAD superfamily hydrolase (TIGR01509 family)
MTRSRALLFDLDGTLVDTERENAEAIAQVLGRRGRPLSDEEHRFVVGHGWREIHEHLLAHGALDLSLAELIAAAAEAKERIVLERGLRVVPGAPEFVREAARAHPAAVVSGSSRREVAFCLRALGLDGALAFFVAAEDVSAGKPSPEGYLVAACRFGVAPADCVVFEDSEAGLAAGRAAGMRVVALGAANFSGQDVAGADLRAADFLALGGVEAVLARLAATAPGGEGTA